MSKTDSFPNQELLKSLYSCNTQTNNASGCKPPPNEKLLQEGWQQRFVADERMLKNAIRDYEELGYEVNVEPLKIDKLREDCGGCKLNLAQFHVIYTRKNIPI